MAYDLIGAKGGIAIYAIDQDTGKLKPTGQQFELDAAVCVQFFQ